MKGRNGMKKIINGKKYDTETAQKMGWWSANYSVSDFHFYEETLFRKRTGEFFLHGSGNAASKYARRIEMNSWGGGEEIIPLTYEAAREWAEEHLDVDDYEKIFGEVSEDEEEKRTTTVSLSVAALEKAKRESSKAGVFLSDYIEKLILKE